MDPAEHTSLTEQGAVLPYALRGEMMFTSKCGSDAAAALVALAKQYAVRDVRVSRELYLEALGTVLFAGRLADGGGAREVAMAAATARPALPAERPPDLLLDGLTALILDGPRAGVGLLRNAVDGFCQADESGLDDGTRWLWPACHAAIIAWDDRGWQHLPARQTALAREAEDRRVLPVALQSLAAALAWSGDFETSRQLITEADSITASTATAVFPYAALPLAAWQGDQTETERLIEVGAHYAVARGEGMGLASIELATALLCNGLRRYEHAFIAARKGSSHPQELWTNLLIPELIEAATHCGQTSEAVCALEVLSQSAQAAGTDWALGTYACSRALVSTGELAERLYREAIERLDETNMRPAAARARLVYGEWLRRERRPLDARAQLRPAYEMSTAIGMAAFAERARLELAATGEHIRETPRVRVGSGLTAREAQIAAMAARGATNAEIGAQLFISPNTVAYHLRKVFTKLDVTTRRQLALRTITDSPP
jgi:DNA-binding CsgD family transcriptional regulator